MRNMCKNFHNIKLGAKTQFHTTLYFESNNALILLLSSSQAKNYLYLRQASTRREYYGNIYTAICKIDNQWNYSMTQGTQTGAL